MPLQARIRFTGSGAEYFRIWVVNLALTVLTLGLYGAWAKVRRLQYFYQHTELDGAVFDYTASPVAILRGRVVAVLLLVLYTLSFEHSAHAGLAVTMLLFAGLPYLLWQSNRFKARNTRYRGLAFGFDGTLQDAYKVYLPVLLVLLGPSVVAAYYLGPNSTLWTSLMGIGSLALLPIFHTLFRRYVQRSLRFGQTAFSFHASMRDFVDVWAMGLIWTFVAALVGMVVGTVVVAVMSVLDRHNGLANVLPVVFGVLMAWVFFLLLTGIFGAKFQNLMWGRTEVGHVRVVSQVSGGGLTWLHATNTLAVILTLGIFRPFAAIRLARFRLESVAILGRDELDRFQAAPIQSRRGATGEGAAEMFDVDLGL